MVHYIETIPGSRAPRRAAIFLTGPIALGSMTAIPVRGYDAAAILAARGYAVASPDFEGTGRSLGPADGRSVTTTSQVQAMAAVIRDLRERFQLGPADVLGESWGGGIAAELCGDPGRARRCVLSTMTYRNPPVLGAALFGSPVLQAGLQAMPSGYWQTPLPLYAGLVGTSPLPVQRFVYRTQPGRYPISQFQEYARRPWFDPTAARVPGLVVRGSDDPFTSDADNRDLASSYGGGARYESIAGGGHLPRLQAGTRKTWWHVVLDFLLR
jgi:pimeloyl-ACP methyl ester carboxylesterase